MIPRWPTKVASYCSSTSAQILCMWLLLVPMIAESAQEMRPITGAPNPPSALELGIVEEIYAVFPKNKDTFFLTRPLKAPPEDLEDLGLLTPQSLILSQNYEVESRTEGAFDRITCEQQFTFGILSMSNELGSIIVGICEKQTKHIDEVARNAGGQLKRMSETFGMPMTQETIDAETIYEVIPVEGGARMYYFSVIVIAHGIGALPTSILVNANRSRAVIVQLDASGTCNRDPSQEHNIPVCTDLKNKLQRLTQRLAQRFGH